MTTDTLTPDQLLHESQWLRGLAFHLVRDVDLADDLYQETILAALRDRSSIRGSFRPWLSGVARRIASGTARREARVRRRERRAARPESEPSAADVVERFALQRTVATAVSELPEPYRATLLLRFWDDLSPRAIAARLELPVETVRTRIKRALARLRETLDQDVGDRKAWLEGLLPLAQQPRRESPWLRVAPWLALPVAAAGLLVFLPTLSGGGGAPNEAPAGSRVAWFRTYDLQGYPMSGVTVGLRGLPDTAVTADSGVGSLSMPASPEELEVRDPGLTAALTSRVGPDVPGAESFLVVVAESRDLSGMVHDQDGRPLPGAEIRVVMDDALRARFESRHQDVLAPLRAVASGADGGFSLPGAPTGPGIRLLVAHPDFEPRSVDLDRGARSALAIGLKRR